MVGPQTHKNRAPKGGEGPKISSFFSPSPAPFSLFLSLSLWVSSRGILLVFEAPEPSNVRVWCSLAVKPPGFHTTVRGGPQGGPAQGGTGGSKTNNTQQHGRHRGGGLAEIGLAKIGWPNGLTKNGLAKIGLAQVGHNRQGLTPSPSLLPKPCIVTFFPDSLPNRLSTPEQPCGTSSPLQNPPPWVGP